MCFRVKYFASEWLLQCCYDRPVIKSKYFSVVETKVRPTKSWPRHYKSGGWWWCVLWALFRQHLGFWREDHLVPPPLSHTLADMMTMGGGRVQGCVRYSRGHIPLSHVLVTSADLSWELVSGHITNHCPTSLVLFFTIQSNCQGVKPWLTANGLSQVLSPYNIPTNHLYL